MGPAGVGSTRQRREGGKEGLDGQGHQTHLEAVVESRGEAGERKRAMIAGSPSASEVMMTTEPSTIRGLPVTVSHGRVTRRTWVYQGHKRTAYVYDVQAAGRRVRRQYPTRAEAQAALDAYRKEAANPTPTARRMTLGEAVALYLEAKSRKRSLAGDRRFLGWFRDYFGAGTPLAQVTAARIAAWKAERLAATCPQTGHPYSPAAVNRPLAALHHLLKLAHEEWEALPAVPKIRLEKEAEGRVRWLSRPSTCAARWPEPTGAPSGPRPRHRPDGARTAQGARPPRQVADFHFVLPSARM